MLFFMENHSSQRQSIASEEEVRRHIGFKLQSRELKAEVGQRMLALLDEGSAPDYQELLRAAMFCDPPALVYHTAPSDRRNSILKDGLMVRQPGHAGNWKAASTSMIVSTQPAGVYVAASPDERGIWSHWQSWDVWEIKLEGLTWSHDELNPGCWCLLDGAPASALRLHGTFNY
jgi:hypothetical protein